MRRSKPSPMIRFTPTSAAYGDTVHEMEAHQRRHCAGGIPKSPIVVTAEIMAMAARLPASFTNLPGGSKRLCPWPKWSGCMAFGRAAANSSQTV
ncbi:MAG: hypothetical protein R2911_10995 [Caldilineaceae bacterium]